MPACSPAKEVRPMTRQGEEKGGTEHAKWCPFCACRESWEALAGGKSVQRLRSLARNSFLAAMKAVRKGLDKGIERLEKEDEEEPAQENAEP